MIVYLVRNLVNGHMYVGKTKYSLGRRWKQHQNNAARGQCSYLCNAIRKWGMSNFSVEMLEETSTEESLNLLEKQYIDRLGTYKNGYNLTLGGEGCVATPETSAKMSKSRKEFLRYNPNPWTGCHHSEETLSFFRARTHSDDNLKLFRLRTHSEETKQGMRQRRHSESTPSEETRNRMRIARKAYCEKKRLQNTILVSGSLETAQCVNFLN